MIRNLNYYLSLCLLIFTVSIYGQNTLNRLNVDISENGTLLPLGAVGGLNMPQYSGADLNNDGIEDMVIFDKEDNRILTFINNGMTNQVDYVYNADYAENFPPIKSWALMKDYNCDGIPDLFARPPEPVDGAAVYQGYYNANNELAFNRVPFWDHFNDVIFYFNPNNFPVSAYVPQTDIPAVEDIDNDGDMDLLSFRQLGSYVVYYENQSVEMGYGCDSLIFELKTDCWGRFFESGVNNSISLSPNVDSCYGTPYFVAGRGRHAGSTILAMDLDNDQDKELLIGDISFNNVVAVSNGGTLDTAFMTSQDNNFPSYDRPVDIASFPGLFSMDVNNDGKKDLLVSPTLPASENQDVTWLYTNISTTNQPNFQFIQEDFIVGQMIDMGTGANPAFIDYNADGLLDLLVGNLGVFDNSGIEKGRLALFENTGTANNPSFNLVDDNYLNVASFDLIGITPTVGDLDGDGDDDILFGDFNGLLYYFENTAGVGNPVAYGNVQPGYKNIQVGIFSNPHIVDVDRDGLSDIVLGDVNGILYFYENTGTQGSPDFTLVTNSNQNGSFGDVDVRQFGFSSGHAAPYFYDNDGVYELFVGSQEGLIYKYTDIEQNLTTPFTVVSSNLGNMRESTYSKVAVADLNNDDLLDFVVGTRRGGITFFSSDLFVNTDPNLQQAKPKVLIQPNPAKEYIQIFIEELGTNAVEMNIYNAIGQSVMYRQFNNISQIQPINVAHLPKSVYFIQLKIGEQLVVKKIVIQ